MTLILDITIGILLGITAYVSTNIDNLFLLLTFHADNSASNARILSGYVAWIMVILTSMLIFTIVRGYIPVNFLELLGIIPLLLGFQKFYSLFRKSKEKDNRSTRKPATGMRTLTVLIILTANSGDTVAVFLPLVMESELLVSIIIAVIFIILSWVWYHISIGIVRHPSVSNFIHRYGEYIIPLIMIAIGIYILSDTATDLIFKK